MVNGNKTPSCDPLISDIAQDFINEIRVILQLFYVQKCQVYFFMETTGEFPYIKESKIISQSLIKL